MCCAVGINIFSSLVLNSLALDVEDLIAVIMNSNAVKTVMITALIYN